MDSPFMETIAGGAAKAGIRVARFEFPYMRRRRETGKGGAPDPGPALMQSWRDTIEKLGGGKRLVIGGKSLGGRIASMIADETGVRGLVCLGYPFHPPGKPERTRTAASRAPAYSRAGPPGNSRYVWQPRGSPHLQTVTRDPDRMARGWRPFLQASRTLGPDGSRQSRRGDRPDRGIYRVALSSFADFEAAFGTQSPGPGQSPHVSGLTRAFVDLSYRPLTCILCWRTLVRNFSICPRSPPRSVMARQPPR